MGLTRSPSHARRVVVTGIGMVTPLGLNAPDTWAAVCRGASGIRPLTQAPHFLPPHIENSRSLSAGEKQVCLDKLISAMPCKVAASVVWPSDGGTDPLKPTAHEPRGFRFSAVAVEEALLDAALLNALPAAEAAVSKHSRTTAHRPRSLCVGDDTKERIGVNIGMGIPSLADVADVATSLYGDLSPDAASAVHYSKVHPMFVPKILGNMAAGVTAIQYGLQGPIGSSVAACATGAHCIGEAAAWIQAGSADVMVCGATEACINPISVAGFSRMRALSTQFNDNPATASRPFDTTRAGFVMGEGAGILILEELSHAVARGAPRIYGEVQGFGVSSDAFHVAAPHPDGRGAQRCIREALRLSGGSVSPANIGYVNAHATGTIGDAVELHAIQRTLRPATAAAPSTERCVTADSLEGQQRPLYISSAKGGLGHLLGAAGSVEAALALLSLKHQLAPPTANLRNACLTEEQRASGLICVKGTEATKLEDCEAVISTSFGFGGVNTALLFTRV